MKTKLALIISTTLLLASSAYAGGYAGKTGWNVGADAGVTRNHSEASSLPAYQLAQQVQLVLQPLIKQIVLGVHGSVISLMKTGVLRVRMKI